MHDVFLFVSVQHGTNSLFFMKCMYICIIEINYRFTRVMFKEKKRMNFNLNASGEKSTRSMNWNTKVVISYLIDFKVLSLFDDFYKIK